MRYLVAIILAVVSWACHADTVPKLSTGTTYRFPGHATWCGGNLDIYSSTQTNPGAQVQSFCKQFVTNACLHNAVTRVDVYSSGTTPSCGGTLLGGWSINTQSIANTSCPANSTYNGTNCTCASGYIAQNGQCVQPPANPCEGLTGQSMIQFGTFVWPRGVTSACSGGCAQTVTGDSPFDFYWKDETTGQFLGHYTSNQFVFTGEQCTGGTAPAALPQNEATEETIAPKCKAGEYYGQVNGQDVCVPSSSTSSTSETTEQTKDSSGNTTGTATTSKDVECEGDSCTVTTTTTNADGTSKVTSGTVSKGEHCASNPGSRECEVSQFAGTCQTGFTCKGDAIQCAQARVQWDSYCKLHADEAAMSLYESAAAKYNTDITGDLPGNQSNAFGSDWFDSSDALGGGSCVADIHVSQWIVEFDIPLSQLCQQLLWLNYALTAAGSLIWALIVFRR